jgi:hypothetical protein
MESETVEQIYAYLNGLNIYKQILGDLALTYHIVLGLSFLSFGSWHKIVQTWNVGI